MYEAPNSDAGEVALYAALVSADVPVISSSWGEPENQENNLASDDADFKEAAAQGQSVYAASGDSGADDDGYGGLSVDYPASDPYVTGVGGTNLTVTSAAPGAARPRWSDSGGGSLVEWSTPSFQTAVNPAATARCRTWPPPAAPSSPWYIDADGSWTDVWGTSAAAPNWAAFTADYDTTRRPRPARPSSGTPTASCTPSPAARPTRSAFHDVKSGSNGGVQRGHRLRRGDRLGLLQRREVHRRRAVRKTL